VSIGLKDETRTSQSDCNGQIVGNPFGRGSRSGAAVFIGDRVSSQRVEKIFTVATKLDVLRASGATKRIDCKVFHNEFVKGLLKSTQIFLEEFSS